MSKGLIFGGWVASVIVGGFIGWVACDHFADKARKEAADAALLAQSKVTEDVRRIEKASRDAITSAAASFEDARSRLETQQPIIETKIREIYRNVPPPPVDCAVPDAGRRLLIDAGARGSAAADGAAASGAGR